MELTKYSEYRLMRTFAEYSVDQDFANPIYNYLVYGYPPGSFFTALLANDALRMLSSSHPANTIPALKKLACWIYNHANEQIGFGSYDAIDNWMQLSGEERRTILEGRRLIYTEKEEMLLILGDEPNPPPNFW